jgi:hypothetical protein
MMFQQEPEQWSVVTASSRVVGPKGMNDFFAKSE